MFLGRFNPIKYTYSKKGGLLVEAALRILPGTTIRSRWLIRNQPARMSVHGDVND